MAEAQSASSYQQHNGAPVNAYGSSSGTQAPDTASAPSNVLYDANGAIAYAPPTVEPGKVKVTFNMLESEYATLEQLSRKRGISKTEVLRRALVMEKYLEDAVSEGAKLLIETKKGIRELLLR